MTLGGNTYSDKIRDMAGGGNGIEKRDNDVQCHLTFKHSEGTYRLRVGENERS
jgi:hypothetical protein